MNIPSEDQMYSLKHLYSSLLLGGAIRNDDIFMKVKLKRDRYGILEKYIVRTALLDYFDYRYDEVREYLYFESTLTVLSLLTELSKDMTTICFVNPRQLNSNVFNLWVSLFAEPRARRLYIPATHFTFDAKETMCMIFEELNSVKMIKNSNYLVIANYLEWFIQMYKANRPIYELNSIIKLDEPQAIEKLKQTRKEFDRKRGVVFG